MTDCAVQVCRSGGIRSWYKESIIILTLMRDVPGSSIEWFGTYEVVKKEHVTLQGIDDDPSKLSPLYWWPSSWRVGLRACWRVGGCTFLPMS
jgi:hypothetical protein